VAATIEAPRETAVPCNLQLASREQFMDWLAENQLTRRRRILVSGSRDWSGDDAVMLVTRELAQLRVGRQLAPVLIEGEASGIDSIARNVARELGWPIAGFPTLGKWWNLHGKAAGMLRNEVMLSCLPSQVIGFSPAIAQSKGTRGCLVIAWELGLPVRVVDATGGMIDHQREAPKRAFEQLHSDLQVRRARP
jgi:hypothetical protein